MESGQNIFTPVADPKEKKKVLTDLVRYSTEVILKGIEPKADVFMVTPQSLIGDDSLLCRILGTPMISAKELEVIVQFTLTEQKYLSQAKSQIADDGIQLSFSGPLYRVQRRQDFRLRLPASFQGTFSLVHDGRQFTLKLADISAGGCRVEAPPAFAPQQGANYKAILATAKRNDLHVEGTVRHIAEHPDKEGYQLIGFQFINQSQIVKNRMAALVMDLYREFFTKRA
jgi:c-di-GMP-binding flagellar brake protein YcgR